MGAQGRTNSSPISMQRVKLYRLSGDGKWDDKGTGHVTVDYMERSEDLGLFVIGEETNETLLAHRIRSDDAYRRQEDTIISWQDQVDTSEVALSFQETTGCAYIWDQICTVQRNMQFSALGDIEIGPRPPMETLETSRTSHSNDDTFHGVSSELRELPGVELSTLPLILKTVVEGGIADQMRVTELILHDQDFFPKLMDLFRICDDLDDLDGLHMIFKLVKGIILLNSSHIFEKIFGDEFIMDIIGCLEYDPDVSQIQHHRSYLKEHVVFKEAIPIKDPIVLSKIHQTYRVGYIKDVILPRVLDETTIANLNSIIHSNNALVVSLLKDDSTFIQELFARMRSSTTSAESKKNLVFFLHEFCGLSKSLQVVQQLRLFRDLMNEGIFDIITDALHTQDKRLVLTGTDILILFLNQDPNLLRSYITRAEGIPLLGLLVKGMITDFGEDMHCQFLEILRSLLDSYTFSGSQRDTIIEMFYDKHLDQLIDVIVLSCPPKAIAQSSGKPMPSDGIVQHLPITKPEILSNICELLCFCVLHHPYRIKCKFLLNNAIEKILFLTRRREKYIVVAAVRFLRTVISRNDEQLLLHIVKNNLLKPIVEAFVRNGNRYNLLNSAVLELFEYIRKENLKTLVIYLVDSLWNQLARFEYLATIHALKVKYEQYIESCQTRSGILAVDPRRRNDDRAPEKEEEEYFNEDSDEEDTASARASHTANQLAARPIFANGTSLSYPALRPGSCGLVDYDDDDDDEDYNPPPRTKPETSTRDERIKSSSPKLKRVSSSNEGLELTKKRRVERTLSEDAITVCTASSACNRAAPSAVNKATTSLCSISNSAEEEKCNTDEENHSGDKSPEVPKSCSNCLPNTTDTRQSSGENGQLLTPNGSNPSEMTAVNGSSVTGSEPYSVR